MEEQHIPAIVSTDQFKKKACTWAQQFDTICILDNNHLENALQLQEIEFAVAVGSIDELVGSGENDWEKFKAFVDKHAGNTPLFGYLTYDLKNQLEKLSSKHPDNIGFDPLFFFAPLHVILMDTNGQLMVMSEQGNEILEAIKQTEIQSEPRVSIQMQQRVSKEKYIETVKKIQAHIEAGDVYELNYCVEFFAENTSINPLNTYFELQQISPTPFSCFVKHNKRYVLSASPERFIKKSLNKLYSQPIKGTVRRAQDDAEDEKLKSALLASEKERAENLMIVDLVRNDLAKSSETGSVEVNELFGIYSFKQVHQMISTVSSTIIDGLNPVTAIANAFPMGSMTGAPKVMAMQLIEQYENSKRGLYSGAIGYFAPNEDFDFNVVIRSIQYNEERQYVNFEVGSAITIDSHAEQEYEECLLKASAMLRALGGINHEA
ncbi:MAG: anthranilate synthase component I family protein [Sphingobacteriales bacterium]|nr:anthranilate synthase component I family protein [Sphingobacteriales bacterium]